MMTVSSRRLPFEIKTLLKCALRSIRLFAGGTVCKTRFLDAKAVLPRPEVGRSLQDKARPAQAADLMIHEG